MKLKLERNWWFVALISGLAWFATSHLLTAVNFEYPYTPSQWAVYLLCFIGIHRCSSFALWLVILVISPKKAIGSVTG